MPSGHAQITSFAATYWSIYLWMKYKQEENIDVKESLKKKIYISPLSQDSTGSIKGIPPLDVTCPSRRRMKLPSSYLGN